MRILRTSTFAALWASILAIAPPVVADPPVAPSDIIAVASSAENLKTLVAAVKAAGLVETLQGTGPFTVFAPTDEAFAKLPKGTLEELLKPENKAKLTGILTYHLLAGKIMASDVKTMKAKTVNGQELSIKVEEGRVTVDKATVIKADIAAANGVIHFIDAVVLPADPPADPPAAPPADPAKAKPKDHPGH